MALDLMFKPGGGGSGSVSQVNLNGLVNYIYLNYDAEAGTTGWATFADAAQSSPENGTGGSPNVTWGVSSTTPLRGLQDFNFVKDAANRQGQGVSYDFIINTADQGKILNISFDYEIVSGTYADLDMSVWIYDVTNAVVIQPAGYSILNGTIPQKKIATFQTASNSVSYRLILFCGSTSASAYTLAFDNFVVGPQIVEYGAPITDWVSYTPASTQGFGTVGTSEFYWRRVGSSIHVRARVTAGTTTGSEARISFPAGLTSASTITTLQMAGVWGRDASASNHGGFVLIEPSVTYFTFSESTTFSNTTSNGFAKAAGNATVSNSGVFSFIAEAPIAGWSSSVIMSNDTDTRVVDFTGYVASDSALTADVTNIPLTTEKDSHLAWSGTVYTIPVPGDYMMGAVVNSSSGGGTNATFYIYKNGARYKNLANNNTSNYYGGFAVVPNCVAGDTITFRSTASSTIEGGTLAATASHFSIIRISGPATIAGTEEIFAKVTGDAASASSGNPVIFPTVSKDTTGGYSASTGRYTVPVSGDYKMYGFITSANTGVQVAAYKNAVSDTILGQTDSNGECAYTGCVVNLVAGDIIDLRPNNTLDAGTGSVLQIERI